MTYDRQFGGWLDNLGGNNTLDCQACRKQIEQEMVEEIKGLFMRQPYFGMTNKHVYILFVEAWQDFKAKRGLK